MEERYVLKENENKQTKIIKMCIWRFFCNQTRSKVPSPLVSFEINYTGVRSNVLRPEIIKKTVIPSSQQHRQMRKDSKARQYLTWLVRNSPPHPQLKSALCFSRQNSMKADNQFSAKGGMLRTQGAQGEGKVSPGKTIFLRRILSFQ